MCWGIACAHHRSCRGCSGGQWHVDGTSRGSRSGGHERKHRGQIFRINARCTPVWSGREGGLAEPKTKQLRLRSSSPRRDAITNLRPTHRRAMSCTVLEDLYGSQHDHYAACLLQLCFRLQCRPAPCGRGSQRLMGPTSSIPLLASISRLEHHR